MRTPNKFINPATGAEYPWAINHSTEDQSGRARQITRSAPTGTATGLGRQQGDDSPRVLTYKGVILTKAQFDEMIAWWGLCNEQTIYFEDFTGARSEVIITNFNPTRRGVMRNHKDLINMPLWVYDYTIEMEVIRELTGPWASVPA